MDSIQIAYYEIILEGEVFQIIKLHKFSMKSCGNPKLNFNHTTPTTPPYKKSSFKECLKLFTKY